MEKELKVDKNLIEKISADYAECTIGILMIAKYYKAKYDALIEVGFSKIEALEIIKARGMQL